MHPRTIIRESVAQALINAGAWKDRVFINRASPIPADFEFSGVPAVCIYTPKERTDRTNGNHRLLQEVSLEIQIYVSRPDIDICHPGQHGLALDAGVILDDACLSVSDVIFASLSNKKIEYKGHQLAIERLDRVDTEIRIGDSGEMPWMVGMMSFSVPYHACFVSDAIETCPLRLVFSGITAGGCGALPYEAVQ